MAPARTMQAPVAIVMVSVLGLVGAQARRHAEAQGRIRFCPCAASWLVESASIASRRTDLASRRVIRIYEPWARRRRHEMIRRALKTKRGFKVQHQAWRRKKSVEESLSEIEMGGPPSVCSERR